MIQWKKLILSTIAALGIACFAGGTADAASVKIDEKTFPDVCVRTAVAQYDKNKDGILSDQERDKVTGIDFDSALAQHYTEGHCVDFEGMQNFTDINSIYLDLRYKAKNNSYKYWNYRADNLTQCFPNAQRISIYWYGNQTISLKGTAVNARKISLYALQNGKLDYSLYAPNAQNVEICGKFTDTKKSYGQYFPDASEVILEETNIGGNNTLAGFKGLQTLYLSGKAITSLNFSPLKNNPIYSLSVERAAWGKCFPNARVVQMNYVKDLEKEIYGFKRVEQISIAYYGGNKIFDLSIYKDTLKRLDIANSWQDLQQNSNPLEEMTTLKTIDISHMRKLETLEACNAGSLERLVVKDSKGKCELNKLKTIHLVNNKIKSLNLSVVPNLEEVYVGGKLTNLNINQCKRLKKLLIDSNSLKKLIIKNRSLKYLDVSSKVIQKINVTGCPNLIGVTIDRKSKASMGNLDLSKNKKLVYFHANRNARFKKIILPKLSNSKQLNTSYKQYDRAEKCRYTGYGITVDVSKYRKMPVKVKKYQVKTLCSSTTKKLVINKKLRKADKKWIKKFAKKWHVKVVEKL